MSIPPKDYKVIDVIIKLRSPYKDGLIKELMDIGLVHVVSKPIHSVVIGEIEAYKISELKKVDGVLDVNTKLDKYDPKPKKPGRGVYGP